MKKISAFILGLSMVIPSLSALPLMVSADTLTQPADNVNLNDSAFSIIVCDGPDFSSLTNRTDITYNGKSYSVPPNPQGYRPCNFNYAMFQVQHLINIAIVVGVFAAIVLLSYAGYIYISAGMRGDANAHTAALAIFQKVGIGFIIMLSAWFIVYQILAWLTDNPGFSFLLGK